MGADFTLSFLIVQNSIILLSYATMLIMYSVLIFIVVTCFFYISCIYFRFYFIRVIFITLLVSIQLSDAGESYGLLH